MSTKIQVSASPGGKTAPHRLRALTPRAFASGDRAAVLFVLHRLGGGAVRTAGFSHAAMLLAGDDAPVVIDDAPPARAWLPRP